jgi:hypothetical protein
MGGFALSTVGLLLSLARQAWVCLIFVGGAVVLYSLRGTKAGNVKEAHTNKIQWKRLAFIGTGILIALVIALAAMRDLSGRLATLSVSEAADDPTVVRRAGLIALAIDDIQRHPLVGLGTSSFQLLYLGDDDSYQGVGQAWLGSLFFRVVHDTGVVGMVLLGWFILNLARRAWRILLLRKSTYTGVGALLAGAVVMVIAYQLTDASTLAFTWIQLGLLATGVRIAEIGSAVAATSN